MWLLALGALLLAGCGRAARPRCPPAAACRELEHVTDDYWYQVDGKRLTISYKELKTFEFTCPPNVSLESESLPRFPEPTGFSCVILQQCALPAARGGLAAALARLGVQPRDELELLHLPPAPALSAAHLAGLPVRALKVVGAGIRPVAVEDDFLSSVPRLTDLRLDVVRLTGASLLALPGGLVALGLEHCGLAALPAAALARLPALRHLKLTEPALAAPPDLTAAPALASLELNAPRLASLVAGPALQNAILTNVTLTAIDGNCSSLERLTVVGARALPAAGWAACARLAELTLRRSALRPGALRGAGALRALTVTLPPNGSLPHDLLGDAPALRHLDLSSNRLQDLPSGLFAASARLERLELRANGLRARSLAALAPFTALRLLDLSDNPLGDLCNSTATYHTNDMSLLKEMRALGTLLLRGAGVTRVCRDWRDAAALPALLTLDLRKNRVAELGYAEAMWPRGTLDLRDNPVRTVLYTREDYERALVAPPAPLAPPRLRLNGELTCDCRAYWLARALHSRPQHAPAALAAVRCAAPPRELRAVPPDDLECPVPQERCAAGCACAVGGAGSVLRCAGGALRELPLPPPPLPPPRVLLAAHNNISGLPPRLPPELQLVDLRHNQIAELPAETWGALLTAPRRALLAGNPLRCGCDQRPALALLQARAELLDADNATCADGRALLAAAAAAPAACQPLAAPLGAALAAALLLALLALACLARPAARHWIKRFLVEHNLCLRLLLRPDREERPAAGAGAGAGEDEPPVYDVFVSFSHHDERFVTEELVPHLEGAKRPRRLCLHYRDWTPGEWIPTQIATSVRASRRTLVVLSEHFLRSTWARAEFRAAHALALRDRRPRLVLLLLAPPAALPLAADRELRAFLAANTYLRRDDPRFWDKLLDALPAGAAPPPASPPAPPPTSPPCA